MITNKSYKVYCCTNKVNGKKYIGITCRSLSARINQHIRESKEKNNYKTYNTPFKRAIRKYGIDNFEHEIIEDCLTPEEAIEKEKYYIKFYQTYYKYSNSNGYNATIGGELVVCPKDKIYQVDSMTGRIINVYNSGMMAQEHHCRGIYESACNHNKTANGYSWFYEKDYMQLGINNVIKILHTELNHIVQIDMNDQLVKIWSGSREVYNTIGINQGNISACCRGSRHYCNGYRWLFYKDWINNIDPFVSISRNKPIVQITKDGKEINIFSSVSEAANAVNGSASNIVNVCKNKLPTAYGYAWRYYDRGE